MAVAPEVSAPPAGGRWRVLRGGSLGGMVAPLVVALALSPAAAQSQRLSMPAAHRPSHGGGWAEYLGADSAYAGEKGGFPPAGGFGGINASEVGAVMCLGDSWQTGLNVGYGDHKQVKGFTDYRGGSFACGDGVLEPGVRVQTLGTLLRRFNPRLEGLSRGKHTSFELNPCSRHSEMCGLNAAVDGASLLTNSNAARAAKSGEERNMTLLDEASDLRAWIDSRYPHLRARWKVLSFLPSWGDQWWCARDIGRIRAAVRELLEYLRSALPYTYVNLLGVSENVHTLDEMIGKHTWCKIGVGMWKARAFFETHTVFNGAKGADEYARQINAELRLAARDFDDGRRFVVRFRPVLVGFGFDRRLTDPMSCFHPNEQLVEGLAYGLLQNMASRTPAEQLKRLPIYTAGTPPKAEREAFNGFKRRVRSARDAILR